MKNGLDTASNFQRIKCAEIFRESTESNVYSFVCFHCGEIFNIYAEIIGHIDETHFKINAIDICIKTNPVEGATNPPLKYLIKDEVFEEHLTSEHIIKDEQSDSSQHFEFVEYEEKIEESAAVPDVANNAARPSKSLNKDKAEESAVIKVKKLRKKCDKNVCYRCTQCDMTYQRKSGLTKHLKIHAREASDLRNGKCGKCGQIFADNDELAQHKLDCKTTYACPDCGKIYHSRYGLNDHREKNHVSPFLQCEICERKFHLKRLLTDHLKMHQNAREFECDICKLRFNCKRHLRGHMHNHRKKIAGVRHKCHLCDKAYRHISNLKSHIRWHTGEKPNKCHICDKSYNQSGPLRIHIMQAHTFEKPHQCETCGDSFVTNTILRKHQMRRHTDLKPHKCEVCGMTFFSIYQLQSHSRKHTGEKAYQCEICNKRFVTISTLTQHHILHTGEKPYKCRFCEKSFAQISGRRGHEKNKHKTCM